MKELSKDYKDLLQLFQQNDVKYVIVGAYAVSFHSVPRNTGDIDLFLEPSKKNAANVMKALIQFGFGDTGLTEKDFDQPNKIVALGNPPYKIDLMTVCKGIEFSEAWKHKISVQAEQLTMHFVDYDTLVKTKTASNRDQDKADLVSLKKSKEVSNNQTSKPLKQKKSK